MEAITGADVNPLPVARALLLIDPAKRLPGVDSGLIDALAARLNELRSIDPFISGEEAVVVHGDAHLGNVIWDGDRLAALLDYEWARLGPPDLDLQPFLRVEEEGHPGELMADLQRTYPALFGHSQLLERLWLYDLA